MHIEIESFITTFKMLKASLPTAQCHYGRVSVWAAPRVVFLHSHHIPETPTLAPFGLT